MEYDLFFGCLGNGMTVCNKAVEEHGDYKKIAHISHDRKITFYDKNIPDNIKTQIIYCAQTDDSTISTSQPTNVFSIPPKNIKFPPIDQVKKYVHKCIWTGTNDSLTIIEKVYYYIMKWQLEH